MNIEDNKKELQYLFDKALHHVRSQGRGSYILSDYSDKEAVCQYRGNDGLQCAAGPFIIKYDPEMENKYFKDIARHAPNSCDPLSVKHSHFVTTLQTDHDSACDIEVVDGIDAFMESYNTKMKEIAKEHGLYYTDY